MHNIFGAFKYPFSLQKFEDFNISFLGNSIQIVLVTGLCSELLKFDQSDKQSQKCQTSPWDQSVELFLLNKACARHLNGNVFQQKKQKVKENQLRGSNVKCKQNVFWMACLSGRHNPVLQLKTMSYKKEKNFYDTTLWDSSQCLLWSNNKPFYFVALRWK